MLKAIMELAEKDDKLMLITGDLGFGLFEEFQERYPHKYINTGIAEQNMIGVATGLALEGMTVFVYSIGNFPTFRCLDQIRNGLCYHDLNVNIISMGAGFSYGVLGTTHHATEDISVIRALPNIDVYSPITELDAYDVINSVYEIDHPSYIRLDKSTIIHSEAVTKFSHMVSQFKVGKDIALLSMGGITQEVLNAADILSEVANISVSVYGFAMIKPMDPNAITNIFKRYSTIVTIEEHVLSGGFGSSILECASIQHLLKNKNFCSIGIDNIFSENIGNQNYLRKLHLIDSQSIYNKVIQLISE